MSNLPAEKIFDSQTNVANSFKFADSAITYQLIITGSPAAAIKVFKQETSNVLNAAFVKAKCSNWNGATIKLQAKTSHDDDAFSDTGDVFSADSGKFLYY